MCKNHSHVTVAGMANLVGEGGTNVALAKATGALRLESESDGRVLTVPLGSTLLIVSPGPGGQSSLPSRLMVVLSVLLSMDWEQLPASGGGTTQPMPKMPWEN